MRKKQLRSVDLNLLPVLDALLRHRNATRAGADVGLSQPAMSRALARLRLLQDLEELLVEQPFDLATRGRTFRIAMTDAQAELLLAPLVRRMAASAPGAILEWVPIAPGISDRILRGEIDLALALDTTPLPPGAASEPLMEDALAVVVRNGHPSGGHWPVDYYAVWPSVMVSLFGDQTSAVDTELAAAGVVRRIGAVVPSFRAAVDILANSDNVTTISRKFAEKVALPLGLTLLPPPFAGVRLGMVMVWGDFRREDPLLAWLRDLVKDAAVGA